MGNTVSHCPLLPPGASFRRNPPVRVSNFVTLPMFEGGLGRRRREVLERNVWGFEEPGDRNVAVQVTSNGFVLGLSDVIEKSNSVPVVFNPTTPLLTTFPSISIAKSSCASCFPLGIRTGTAPTISLKPTTASITIVARESSARYGLIAGMQRSASNGWDGGETAGIGN